MSKKMFNGKPMQHWERMAKEDVVDHLLRSAFRCDQRSLPGAIAYKRLMELAMTESAEITSKLLDERARCQANLGSVLNSILD